MALKRGLAVGLLFWFSLPAQATLYDWCARYLGYLDPTVKRVLREADEEHKQDVRGSHHRERSYLKDQGLAPFNDIYKPPEFAKRIDKDKLKAHFEKIGRTPVVLLQDLANKNPKAAPFVRELLERAERDGKEISWTTRSSVAYGNKIELSLDFSGDRVQELGLLPTLAHELTHTDQFPQLLHPGETKVAFVERVSKVLEADELAAINAGIEIAVRMEEMGLGKAESLLTAASVPVYRIRQKRFRTPELAREAERLALLSYDDSAYPSLWKEYLESRWDVLQGQ